MFNFSGTRPNNLGVKDGKLAPCPGSPNCISSQSEDPQFKIDPLPPVTGGRRRGDEPHAPVQLAAAGGGARHPRGPCRSGHARHSDQRQLHQKRHYR